MQEGEACLLQIYSDLAGRQGVHDQAPGGRLLVDAVHNVSVRLRYGDQLKQEQN